MDTFELRGLIQNYVETADDRLLRVIKAVVESYKEESSDWWDEMNDEERQEAEIGLMQSDKGQLIPDKDVMNVFDKWH
jgi:signal transduction histidine kinase